MSSPSIKNARKRPWGNIKPFPLVIFCAYLCSNVLFVHAQETHFWESRRAALRAAKPEAGENLMLAALPRLAAGGASLPNALLPLPSSAPIAQRIAEQIHGRGALRELHLSAKAGAPLVLHIQDLHDSPEAQTNAAAMVAALGGPSQGALVGVEGAFGAFDFAPFRHFPDENIGRGLADFMLKDGLVGGPEHAALVESVPPTLWGVEDRETYAANVESVRAAAEAKTKLAPALSEIRGVLAQVKSRVFSPPLAEFHRRRDAFAAGGSSLGDFAGYLLGAAGPGGYTQLRLFHDAVGREKSLDFAAVEIERRAVLQALSDKLPRPELDALVAASLQYRAGRITYGQFSQDFLALCRAKGVGLSQYPRFLAYIDYVLLSEKIKRDLLAGELSDLEKAIGTALTKTPDERAAAGAAGRLALLEKLASHAFTPDDWARYSAEREAALALPAEAARLARHHGAALSADWDAADWKPFEDFCRLAVSRNAALVDNLLAKMAAENRQQAVLIAGGFHTEGLTRLLRERQASYAVLTPAVTGKLPSDTKTLDLLARDPVPLEKFFAGRAINVVAPRGTSPETAQRFPQFTKPLSAAAAVLGLGLWMTAHPGAPTDAAERQARLLPFVRTIQARATPEGPLLRLELEGEKTLEARVAVNPAAAPGSLEVSYLENGRAVTRHVSVDARPTENTPGGLPVLLAALLPARTGSRRSDTKEGISRLQEGLALFRKAALRVDEAERRGGDKDAVLAEIKKEVDALISREPALSDGWQSLLIDQMQDLSNLALTNITGGLNAERLGAHAQDMAALLTTLERWPVWLWRLPIDGAGGMDKAVLGGTGFAGLGNRDWKPILHRFAHGLGHPAIVEATRSLLLGRRSAPEDATAVLMKLGVEEGPFIVAIPAAPGQKKDNDEASVRFRVFYRGDVSLGVIHRGTERLERVPLAALSPAQIGAVEVVVPDGARLTFLGGASDRDLLWPRLTADPLPTSPQTSADVLVERARRSAPRQNLAVLTRQVIQPLSNAPFHFGAAFLTAVYSLGAVLWAAATGDVVTASETSLAGLMVMAGIKDIGGGGGVPPVDPAHRVTDATKKPPEPPQPGQPGARGPPTGTTVEISEEAALLERIDNAIRDLAEQQGGVLHWDALRDLVASLVPTSRTALQEALAAITAPAGQPADAGLALARAYNLSDNDTRIFRMAYYGLGEGGMRPDRSGEPELDAIFQNLAKYGRGQLTAAEKRAVADAFLLVKRSDFYRGRRLASGLGSYSSFAIAMAQQVARMDGTPTAVIAALLGQVNPAENKAFGPTLSKFPRAFAAAVPPLVENWHIARAVPYLPYDKDPVGIGDMMGILLQLLGDDRPGETFRLLEASKLMDHRKLPANQETDRVREIQHIFAPLAERLGRPRWGTELLEESFVPYQGRIAALTRAFFNYATNIPFETAPLVLESWRNRVATALAERGIDATVIARVKSLYSIGQKDRWITDFLGMMIVLGPDSRPASELRPLILEALASVSSNHRPLELRRRTDFNEYRTSAHMRIPRERRFEPDGSADARVEIQVYSDADYKKYIAGTAAHWKYKLRELVPNQAWKSFSHEPTGNVDEDARALNAVALQRGFVLAFHRGRWASMRFDRTEKSEIKLQLFANALAAVQGKAGAAAINLLIADGKITFLPKPTADGPRKPLDRTLGIPGIERSLLEFKARWTTLVQSKEAELGPALTPADVAGATERTFLGGFYPRWAAFRERQNLKVPTAGQPTLSVRRLEYLKPENGRHSWEIEVNGEIQGQDLPAVVGAAIAPHVRVYETRPIEGGLRLWVTGTSKDVKAAVAAVEAVGSTNGAPDTLSAASVETSRWRLTVNAPGTNPHAAAQAALAGMGTVRILNARQPKDQASVFLLEGSKNAARAATEVLTKLEILNGEQKSLNQTVILEPIAPWRFLILSEADRPGLMSFVLESFLPFPEAGIHGVQAQDNEIALRVDATETDGEAIAKALSAFREPAEAPRIGTKSWDLEITTSDGPQWRASLARAFGAAGVNIEVWREQVTNGSVAVSMQVTSPPRNGAKAFLKGILATVKQDFELRFVPPPANGKDQDGKSLMSLAAVTPLAGGILAGLFALMASGAAEAAAVQEWTGATGVVWWATGAAAVIAVFGAGVMGVHRRLAARFAAGVETLRSLAARFWAVFERDRRPEVFDETNLGADMAPYFPAFLLPPPQEENRPRTSWPRLIANAAILSMTLSLSGSSPVKSGADDDNFRPEVLGMAAIGVTKRRAAGATRRPNAPPDPRLASLDSLLDRIKNDELKPKGMDADFRHVARGLLGSRSPKLLMTARDFLRDRLLLMGRQNVDFGVHGNTKTEVRMMVIMESLMVLAQVAAIYRGRLSSKDKSVEKKVEFLKGRRQEALNAVAGWEAASRNITRARRDPLLTAHRMGQDLLQPLINDAQYILAIEKMTDEELVKEWSGRRQRALDASLGILEVKVDNFLPHVGEKKTYRLDHEALAQAKPRQGGLPAAVFLLTGLTLGLLGFAVPEMAWAMADTGPLSVPGGALLNNVVNGFTDLAPGVVAAMAVGGIPSTARTPATRTVETLDEWAKRPWGPDAPALVTNESGHDEEGTLIHYDYSWFRSFLGRVIYTKATEEPPALGLDAIQAAYGGVDLPDAIGELAGRRPQEPVVVVFWDIGRGQALRELRERLGDDYPNVRLVGMSNVRYDSDWRTLPKDITLIWTPARNFEDFFRHGSISMFISADTMGRLSKWWLTYVKDHIYPRMALSGRIFVDSAPNPGQWQDLKRLVHHTEFPDGRLMVKVPDAAGRVDPILERVETSYITDLSANVALGYKRGPYQLGYYSEANPRLAARILKEGGRQPWNEDVAAFKSSPKRFLAVVADGVKLRVKGKDVQQKFAMTVAEKFMELWTDLPENETREDIILNQMSAAAARAWGAAKGQDGAAAVVAYGLRNADGTSTVYFLNGGDTRAQIVHPDAHIVQATPDNGEPKPEDQGLAVLRGGEAVAAYDAPNRSDGLNQFGSGDPNAIQVRPYRPVISIFPNLPEEALLVLSSDAITEDDPKREHSQILAEGMRSSERIQRIARGLVEFTRRTKDNNDDATVLVIKLKPSARLGSPGLVTLGIIALMISAVIAPGGESAADVAVAGLTVMGLPAKPWQSFVAKLKKWTASAIPGWSAAVVLHRRSRLVTALPDPTGVWTATRWSVKETLRAAGGAMVPATRVSTELSAAMRQAVDWAGPDAKVQVRYVNFFIDADARLPYAVWRNEKKGAVVLLVNTSAARIWQARGAELGRPGYLAQMIHTLVLRASLSVRVPEAVAQARNAAAQNMGLSDQGLDALLTAGARDEETAALQRARRDFLRGQFLDLAIERVPGITDRAAPAEVLESVLEDLVPTDAQAKTWTDQVWLRGISSRAGTSVQRAWLLQTAEGWQTKWNHGFSDHHLRDLALEHLRRPGAAGLGIALSDYMVKNRVGLAEVKRRLALQLVLDWQQGARTNNRLFMGNFEKDMDAGSFNTNAQAVLALLHALDGAIAMGPAAIDPSQMSDRIRLAGYSRLDQRASLAAAFAIVGMEAGDSRKKAKSAELLGLLTSAYHQARRSARPYKTVPRAVFEAQRTGEKILINLSPALATAGADLSPSEQTQLLAIAALDRLGEGAAVYLTVTDPANTLRGQNMETTIAALEKHAGQPLANISRRALGRHMVVGAHNRAIRAWLDGRLLKVNAGSVFKAFQLDRAVVLDVEMANAQWNYDSAAAMVVARVLALAGGLMQDVTSKLGEQIRAIRVTATSA